MLTAAVRSVRYDCDDAACAAAARSSLGCDLAVITPPQAVARGTKAPITAAPTTRPNALLFRLSRFSSQRKRASKSKCTLSLEPTLGRGLLRAGLTPGRPSGAANLGA